MTNTAADYPVKSPRKLIEVALPLDVINVAAAREKSIRHGHPSTLHLWWARRPLAAARAVIFAQMVNDPGYQQGNGFKYGKNKKEAAIERKRLFDIIEELVKWENTTNEEVLERARAEIRRSWREVCELNKDHPQAAELFNPDKLPALHDPFAGGGAIPLEAQRLGLEAYASDLNPVAVLINKAMIEIPPKFAGQPPVNPASRRQNDLLEADWQGARGLAEDVRYYGQWMRDEAVKRIGHLYPKVEITEEMVAERPDLEPLVGQQLTVIAWIWARTVKSPNPAFRHVDVPLASTFILSSKPGKEAYVEPVVSGDKYEFKVRVGTPPAWAKAGTKAARGSNFTCLLSNTPIDANYIMNNGLTVKLGSRLMAVVLEGTRGRIYVSPDISIPKIKEMPDISAISQPMPNDRRWFSPPLYGMPNWSDVFTERQLVALTTFSDLVQEAREQVKSDYLATRQLQLDESNETPLEQGGTGAQAYADAVSVYLAFAIDKCADRGSTLGRWDPTPTQSGVIATFSRQALPMTWDFAEANPLGAASGNYLGGLELVIKSLLNMPCLTIGCSSNINAVMQRTSWNKIISTDPPYYDNIGYADLSDYFYSWIRRSLKLVFPDLLSTLTVPKKDELVATPYRHGGRENAEIFFLDGMTKAMTQLSMLSHTAFPASIYYAFKQSDTDNNDATTNTGWITFLEAVMRSGFSLIGTWPMRTELSNRLIGMGTNALASSIVLVCRKRSPNAPTTSRREFIKELNTILPEAMEEMTKGSGEDVSPVAPVDLSQAIIGPGMAVFSKYSAVLEADGSPMTVKTALQLINRFLAESDFDADTGFCLSWFEQYGWQEGPFGEADVLARAKGTSVDGVRSAGVIASGGGRVRLLKWAEYETEWNPADDDRLPVWEVLHRLIRALRTSSETRAGQILSVVSHRSEATRQLAYRLYTLCERRNWAEDARAYNELVTSWEAIEAAAAQAPPGRQGELF